MRRRRRWSSAGQAAEGDSAFEETVRRAIDCRRLGSRDGAQAVDLRDGKRVLARRRGGPGERPVVVAPNFSDLGTADPFGRQAEYRVHGWPATAPGQRWREVTQARGVPPEWVGREPIFPWEAKVYAVA